MNKELRAVSETFATLVLAPFVICLFIQEVGTVTLFSYFLVTALDKSCSAFDIFFRIYGTMIAASVFMTALTKNGRTTFRSIRRFLFH